MKYRLNDEKIYADIADGIAIIISIEDGIYYGLNLLTTDIFDNIINGVDTGELLEKLSGINGYNEDVRSRYLSLVQELVSREFIVEEENPASLGLPDISLNIDEFCNKELDFVISEYQDAAELLLADPIHQVKEEVGWGPSREVLK